MRLLVLVWAVACLAGCQSGPQTYKPPDSYIGEVRPATTSVMLFRPGETDPGPNAELLGRYLRTGGEFSAKDAVKLARAVGANLIIYSSSVQDLGRGWRGYVGGGFRQPEPKYENDVLFYRDPARPGL